MTSPERSGRLVDLEFRVGELPAAAPTPAVLEQVEQVLASDPRMRASTRVALTAAVVFLVVLVVDGVATLARNVIQAGGILDLVLLAAVVGLIGSVGWLVVDQTRALRKLKSAERARDLAVQLAKLDGVGSGARLVATLQIVYAQNPKVLGTLNAAASGLQPYNSDRDVIDLLNREVFAPMDREADDRIQKAALRASLGVSSCPHPSLDALVVLAVSLMLVRDLMQIYGLRHSARSLYRVMTRALFTASSTAVMSTVVELAIKATQGIAAAVVGTAGEAVVVARRMFALGALAKAEIRPLPPS